MSTVTKELGATALRCVLGTRGFWAVAAACLLPALGRAQAVGYGAPLVITKGGTYTGNYQSLASAVPCVLVNTTEPVVLQGCRLAGAGDLIQSGSGANLTVRNCTGTGLAPSVDNQAPGRFLDAYQSQNLVIEHNLFTGTSGIVVNRWSGSGPGQALTVRYNQARNIDGRWRNAGGSTRSSFLILNTVQHLAGVEIAYNEVQNAPDQSLVEDNLNFYNSSGTAGSPLHIHDNFVRGAYPFPASSPTFTGSGFTTDGDATTPDGATAYIEADHNQFVATCNAGMNIAAGHDVYFHDNRLVTSGLLPNGAQLASTYAATAVFNYYNLLAAVFGNNRIENNTIGYVRWGSNNPYPNRQDLSPGACGPCTGTVHLPNPVTLATEDNEAALWQQKLQQAGLILGPAGAAAAVPPATVPPATPGQVANPGFEADGVATDTPTGWQTTAGAGTNGNADYTESYAGAHSGTYHGTHYRPDSYEVYTYQTVTNLPAGTYALRAWMKSSGGQPLAQLQAKNYGGAPLATNVGATSGNWVQVEVKGIAVSNGQCEIGFYSKAQGGQWLYFDDVTLAPYVAPNVPPTVALTAAASLVLGQPLALSAAVADSDGTVAKVEFFNGSAKLGEDTAGPVYQLSWTPPAAGTYSLTAVATDNAGARTTSAAVAVAVAAPPVAPAPAPDPVAGANLAVNPGFEADGYATGTPTGWQKNPGPGSTDRASYTESYAGAHSGTYHGTHYQPGAYVAYTYQVVANVPSGTYAFSAWVKSSGGQAVAQMRASNYGGPLLTADLLPTPNGVTAAGWVLLTIPNIAVSNGQCEIGFYSDASAGGQAIYFDDVTLALQTGAPTAPVAAPSPVAPAPPVVAAPPAGTAPTANIFPIPADGQVAITVNFNQPTDVVLLLTDMQGTPVGRYPSQATAGNNRLTIETGAVPSGIYILQIQSSQPTLVQRLEVRH